MRAPIVAVTGGTGFVGRHLAERMPRGHAVVISRRTGIDVDDVEALTAAFIGCDVVAPAPPTTLRRRPDSRRTPFARWVRSARPAHVRGSMSPAGASAIGTVSP